jgi:uncharacterized membrane protein
MNFGFLNKAVTFLSEEEKASVHAAIKDCEIGTSGEVRVYIEGKCALVDPLARASEIFASYKMYSTQSRNGVLIYVAYKHKEYAIYGDSGAIKHFPSDFWAKQARALHYQFMQGHYNHGLVHCIASIKEQFHLYFPSSEERKNDLPDEIIFGK